MEFTAIDRLFTMLREVADPFLQLRLIDAVGEALQEAARNVVPALSAGEVKGA